MASDAQIAANRRNAQASTGPTSDEGKDISRRNGLRHGLEARVVPALGEDGAAFDRHFLDLCHTLLPYNAYEFALVRRLAQLSWRLERLARMEAAMLEGVARRHEALRSLDGKTGFGEVRPADDIWTDDLPLVARYESQLDNAFRRNMMLLERAQAARRERPGTTQAPDQASIAGEPDPASEKIRSEPNFQRYASSALAGEG